MRFEHLSIFVDYPDSDVLYYPRFRIFFPQYDFEKNWIVEKIFPPKEFYIKFSRRLFILRKPIK